MKKRSVKSLEDSIILKTFPFLKIVSELPAKEREKILKMTNGDESIHKSLRELSYNYLNGNLKTNKKPKKSDIKLMYELTKEKNRTKYCDCEKRSYHIQKGSGILTFLIPAVATLLSSLINKNE